MNFKQYLICFIATGFFFGCGEQVDTGENFPLLTQEEPLTIELDQLRQYAPKSMAEFDNILDVAKAENMPVLIYFTGYACVNCRKMEDFTWFDSFVFQLLKDEFIIASLYVDSRELTDSETVGELWMDYQKEKYNSQTQPIYDIVNWDNNSMVNSLATYQSHFQHSNH